MAYKWKPSKTARREFAQKMANDSEFASAYHDRQEKKAEKRRAGSQFDYRTAGGSFVPTKDQHDAAMQMVGSIKTEEQKEAARIVIQGYSCNEKIHHDYIHVVNEWIRSKNPKA